MTAHDQPGTADLTTRVTRPGPPAAHPSGTPGGGDGPAGTVLRGRVMMLRGVLVLRWATLLWMLVFALTGGDGYQRPGLAWAVTAATAAWTFWLTARRPRWSWPLLTADLAVAVGLVAVSGLVTVPAGLDNPSVPVFAAPYPAAAVLTWAVVLGARGALAAGTVATLALAGAYTLNGADLTTLRLTPSISLVRSSAYFYLAGGAVGFVTRLLDRYDIALQEARNAELRARERSARMTEREAMARDIHDSVLQVLAMVHKQGRELAGTGTVPAEEMRRLAELAGQQERQLRAIVLRPPGDDHDIGDLWSTWGTPPGTPVPELHRPAGHGGPARPAGRPGTAGPAAGGHLGRPAGVTGPVAGGSTRTADSSDAGTPAGTTADGVPAGGVTANGPTTAGSGISLRSVLEQLANRLPAHLTVSVGATGALMMPPGHVRAMGGAVRQALDNVVEHAGARRVWVFAEEEDPAAEASSWDEPDRSSSEGAAGRTGSVVIVTVRDDGCGFELDEAALRQAGKMGVLRSMRGRMEDLGGTMQVLSPPGGGTEIELRMPRTPP